ncbi:hypothetical protein LMG29660_05055 [Burkholderia puraquae]|uniref:Uncharacterized protein n=1 Tax=Burkholderia puraquae TaxID=1904757 RepID=A0A6J5EI23_9BURK|nr:hypothetical protein LMG29660_05055 [Burkholderia puraquae]
MRVGERNPYRLTTRTPSWRRAPEQEKIGRRIPTNIEPAIYAHPQWHAELLARGIGQNLVFHQAKRPDMVSILTYLRTSTPYRFAAQKSGMKKLDMRKIQNILDFEQVIGTGTQVTFANVPVLGVHASKVRNSRWIGTFRFSHPDPHHAEPLNQRIRTHLSRSRDFSVSMRICDALPRTIKLQPVIPALHNALFRQKTPAG